MDFLLPSCPGLKLTHMEAYDEQLVLTVTSTDPPVACCPVCQTASRQVHCYYTRTVAELCWADLGVRLKLRVRRFVCANPVLLTGLYNIACHETDPLNWCMFRVYQTERKQPEVFNGTSVTIE